MRKILNSAEIQKAISPSSGESKIHFVKDMFTRIAPRYDLVNTLATLRRDGSWRRKAASLAGIRNGDITIDIATGTGKFAEELAKTTQFVVAVDFCPQMILKAEARSTSSKSKDRVLFVLGDALSLPFKDNSFDCATMGFALRNVADVARCLSEIRRVVKHGSKVVCLEISMPRSRIVRFFYRFYLFHVIPLIGYSLLRDKGKEAYQYLPLSVVNFHTPTELKEIMQGVGLCQVKYYLLNMGTISIHIAYKQ